MFWKKKNNNFFEQYKIAVESTEKNSDRRMKANQFFVSLNTLILGIAFVKLINIKLWIIIWLFWIILSFIWYSIIENYRILNSAKFKVIHKMEQNWLYEFYKEEWEILKNIKYWKLSKVEQKIPYLFWILYLILFLYSIIIIYLLPFLWKLNN